MNRIGTHIIIVPEDDVPWFSIPILHPQLGHGGAERDKFGGDGSIRRRNSSQVEWLEIVQRVHSFSRISLTQGVAVAAFPKEIAALSTINALKSIFKAAKN